jgi:two-component system, sensor histidine kinase
MSGYKNTGINLSNIWEQLGAALAHNLGSFEIMQALGKSTRRHGAGFSHLRFLVGSPDWQSDEGGMTQVVSPQQRTTQANNPLHSAERGSRWIWVADLINTLTHALQSFRHYPELTGNQEFLLKRRLIQAFAIRAGYWLLFLLLGNILTITFAEKNPHSPYGFSITVWSVGLWFIGLVPYIRLLFSATQLPEDCAPANLRRINFLLCAWALVLITWWMLGSISLLYVPFVRGQPPKFVFSQQTFIILTLTGQVISLVLLAPSNVSKVAIWTISVLTLFGSWYLGLFATPIFVIWNGAQLCVYFMLAWIIGRDERRYHARAVVEQEAKLVAQQATSVAQEALANVNKFVGALSHDMRQPLGAISLRLEYMRETNSDPAILRNVNVIQSQVTALETVMLNTLDLSRLRSGTWEVHIKEVNLPEIIDAIATDFAEDMNRAGLEFKVETLRYVIMTDATALTRILRNLVSNALRYTPAMREKRAPGQVLLRCELHEAEKFVRIAVEDNGIGIPEDKIEEVFKEFVQLSNPERNREKGFGLGLSIVQGLAELLSHTAGVTSKIGLGSTFWIDVPFVSKMAESLVSSAEFQSHANTLVGMVVAVVEDDVAERENLSALLIVWGSKVVAAETAREVVAELSGNDGYADKLSFIIADYDLPNETGPEAIATISTAVGRTIPAVIWTATTAPELLREIAARGYERFTKPVDVARLWSLLDSQRRVSCL